MKKKLTAILSATCLLIVGVAAYFGVNTGNKGGLLEESAFRARADMLSDTVFYLEDNLPPLSDASGYNTALRAEALEASNMINDIRASYGAEPLAWDMNLEAVSALRSEEISEVFSHTRPNGQSWNSVNSREQGGENLAFGFDDASSVVNAWVDSPTHFDNIIYPEFSRAAISIYQTDDGILYWAQEFGYP